MKLGCDNHLRISLLTLMILTVSFAFQSRHAASARSSLFAAASRNSTEASQARSTMSPRLHFSVDVWPHDTPDEALKDYKSFKTVHFIRHAEGAHNVNMAYRDILNLDARLTDRGKEQCRAVAKRIAKCRIGTIHHDIYTRVDLLVASPLTRCIATLIRTCKPILAARPQTPVIAHEYIRETVNYNCDRRRPVSSLVSEFPIVQFDMVPNHDTLWQEYEEWLGSAEQFTSHRESAQIYKVAERARNFFRWLATRPESNVVICSHRAFLRAVMNYGYGEATNVEQILDTRDVKEDVPVFNFKGDSEFAQTMRADYDNCELRSVRLAFP